MDLIAIIAAAGFVCVLLIIFAGWLFKINQFDSDAHETWHKRDNDSYMRK